MAMSYNVRFWDIRERSDRRKPFQIRWTVKGREKSASFITFALADSRRAKLMTAAREGEPFDEHTGLPASELRAIKQRTTWYDLAHEYIEQRWERTPGNTRRTLADAFATITPALVHPGATYSDPRVLRRALYSWAFNKNAWQREPDEEWLHALDWMKRNSLPASALADADVLRRALDAMCRKLDGKAAAAKTARRKRAAFNEALNTAVEKRYFAENPLNGLRTGAAERLFGHPGADVLGRPASDLLASSEDASRVAEVVERCRAAGCWSGFLDVRRSDGQYLKVGLQISPMADSEGCECWLVFAIDLAKTPSWAVSSVLEGFLTRSPIGMAVLSPDLRYVWMNDTLERYGGIPREERLGRRMSDSLPGLDTAALEAQMRRVLETGEPVIDYEYQGWTWAEPHRQHAYSTSFFRLLGADGDVLGVCYMGTDVTDRWKARERLNLLNEAGARIGRTLDVMRTAQELAEAAVPRLADCVLVDLLEPVLHGEEPTPGPVGSKPVLLRAGMHSIRAGTSESIVRRGEPVDLLPSLPGGQFLVDGKAFLTPRLDPDSAWVVEDPSRAEKIREFGLHSVMVVPLRARGNPLGVAAFVRSRHPDPFEEDDLLLAEELVARAAVSVDNARRYAREHAAALALQRSLLPHALTGGSALEVASLSPHRCSRRRGR